MVALNCEAKPIVDYYRLSKQYSRGFSFWHRPQSEQNSYGINLVVSGIGQQNMAAACGWLAGKLGDTRNAWLNVGIAGHGTLDLGEIVRVVCATSADSQAAHFPPLVVKWAGKNAPIQSGTEPIGQYPDAILCDMEASAFFNASLRFADAELVQALKIVSDNTEHSAEELNATRITSLIADKIMLIHEFSCEVMNLLGRVPQIAGADFDISKHHCTLSQSLQFRDVCNKIQNLGVDEKVIVSVIGQAPNMKALLEELKQVQQSTVPKIAEG
jgi:nucleoside phosphorylase